MRSARMKRPIPASTNAMTYPHSPLPRGGRTNPRVKSDDPLISNESAQPSKIKARNTNAKPMSTSSTHTTTSPTSAVGA